MPRAAYIHVPFCVHRCGYCDFTVLAGRNELAPAYLAAMRRQLEMLQEPRPVDTLFIGGGTPTHLALPQLQELLQMLRDWFVWPADGEFSMEANPHGLTDEKLRLLASFGVNRISLGVQSLSEHVLRVLERDHSPESAVDAIRRCREIIPNTSCDLIFGVPGQSQANWEQTLQTVIDTGVPHVSTYGLTFEKGTRFWSRREHGELPSAEEELELEMYRSACQRLSTAGLQQYEISNHAQPGFECRHNNVYWSAAEYFGFGPGAARYVSGERAVNHRSTTTWIRRVMAGEDPIAEHERLAPEDRARECMVLGLRRNAGVNRREFSRVTGFELETLLADPIHRCLQRGWIADDGHSIALTAEGRYVADSVMAEFL